MIPYPKLWILVVPRRWGWGTIWALGSVVETPPHWWPLS